LAVHYQFIFLTRVFFTSVVFVIVLLTVSTFAAEVSVDRFVVSTFTVVSVDVFDELEESTLDESAELPDFFPPHAAADKDKARTKMERLIAFFMIALCFIVSVTNNYAVLKFYHFVYLPLKIGIKYQAQGVIK